MTLDNLTKLEAAMTPFLYALADIEGRPVMSEYCVAEAPSELEECNQDEIDNLTVKIIPVYAGPQIEALRNAAPALIECARLLRKARESVEYEMQDLHESYGERLMHKQQPVIDLLAAIDAALARLPKETK